MTDVAVLRVLASLALIIVTILALAWLARRTGWIQGKHQNRLKVVTSLRLGARSHISIIEVDNTQLVLGITPTQINVLHTLPESSACAAQASPETSSRPHDHQATAQASDALFATTRKSRRNF